MRASASLSLFFQENSNEIDSLIVSVCYNLNYKGPREDVRQDLLIRMHCHDILSRYDAKKGKISTYLYKIIHAGYGAAQSLPGPLFTFAAYLGAIVHDSNFSTGLFAYYWVSAILEYA